MTNEKYTEEFQKALNDYIKLGFNQDECNGFMHGFHKGAEAQQLILPIVSNQRELLNAFAEWLKKDDDHNLINKYTVDAYLESI
tara:strand:- start:78 stop:329 length:252 start_codon:yes stop_codon:yes gene_type:complete